MRAAETAQVELLPNRSPVRARRHPNGCFELEFADRACLTCDTLLLATGGCRAPAAAQLAMSLGHSLSAPVPSLFTFHVAAPWLTRLAGVSLPSAEVCLPEFRRRETGPVLITHSGLSGPAILRLSAWCARPLHEAQYRATLRVNWLPHLTADELVRRLGALRSAQPARLVANSALTPLPSRLWESLVLASGLPRGTRWAEVSRSSRHALVQQLQQTGLEVIGKTLNQDEFVTCGGVPLNEVDMKTMESRICPGLHFAGELLDIDGLTGGFNFQAAWTTGWLAGQAMAARAVQVTSF
jgi:predicted Rossmann fold flavoprotein